MKIFALFAVCLAALALFSCGEKAPGAAVPDAPAATGEFSVTVLDVGKADAIILRTENHTVLIDAGNRGDGGEILEYLAENGVTKADYFFITHFDGDHVGGAVKVMHELDIGEIVAPNYKGTSGEYARYVRKLAEFGLKQHTLTENMYFVLDDVLFEVFPARKNYYKESDNDYSIAVRATHGENVFLFAGDAERERLDELIALDGGGYAFLKVPHHGRLAPNSEAFFRSVSPEYAVVTDSADEPADAEVLKMLEDIGCTVLETRNGTVQAVSDGVSLTVSQSPPALAAEEAA